ncbi:MAG: hypothetical protein PHC51_11155 [bacterium]|nr:hypothetical protein [bacterium]
MAEATDPGQGVERSSPEELDRYAEISFDHAMSQLSAGDYGNFVDKLAEVTNKLGEFGFISFPSFSEETLRIAEMVLREGDEVNGLFLVRKAVELSPYRSEAYFSAARLYFSSDKLQSIRYAFNAVQHLSNSPRVLLGAGITLLLILLVSLTISLLLVIIGEVAFGLGDIYRKIGQMFRVQNRGLGSATVMAALLVLPILPGVLSALIIWGAISTLTFRHCRYFFLTSAATVAAWGLSIPVMQAVIATMHISDDTVVEDVAEGAYRPGNLKLLSAKTHGNSSTDEIDFSYAFLLQKLGQREEAEMAYNRILKGKSSSSSTDSMIKNNLAEIYMRQGEPARAKTYLEEAQLQGLPQIYAEYNMSRLSLALLDTMAHQQFYQAAKSRDSSLVDEFDKTVERGNLAILGLGKSDILRYFFHAHQIAGPEVFNERKKREQLLSGALLHGSSASLLTILGLLLTASGLAAVFARTYSDSEVDKSVRSTSRLWLFIPGGDLLIHKRPVAAALIAAFFISLVILSLDAPLVAFSVLPNPGGMSTIFMFSGLIYYFGNLMVSLFFRRRSFGK